MSRMAFLESLDERRDDFATLLLVEANDRLADDSEVYAKIVRS